MRTLEVRCCCDPGKLLGYLELDDRLVYPGSRLRFAIHRMPLVFGRPLREQVTGETVELEVDWHGTFLDELLDEMQLAVKSNDTPIGQLRRVPGFRECLT